MGATPQRLAKAASSGIYLFALGRMSWHLPTRAYVTRRTTAGLSKAEIIRCLKRYLARELYRMLVRPPASSPRPADDDPMPPASARAS